MKKKVTPAQLLDQGQKLFATQQYEPAMQVMDQIEELTTDRQADIAVRMKALNLKGLIYMQWTDYKNSEKFILLSLAIAQQLGDLRATYIRYENLSGLYLQRKEYQKAIQALQQSIELKEKSGNEADIPRSLLQLSSLLFGIENNDAGMAALRKAGAMVRRLGLHHIDYMLHFNTAMQYKRMGKNKEALREYAKCIEASLHTNDYPTAAKASNNQGDISMQTGAYAQAKKYFTLCIQYAELGSMPFLITTSRLQLAHIALRENDLPLTRRLYDQVAAQATALDDPMVLRDLSELAMKLHEAEGDLAAALEASRAYMQYYKLYYDNEMSRTVLDMQGKYETEKAERELQKANLRQAESELKALRAQMDPHFIFNALSSMRREMLEGNIENADRYLVRFSKLLRMILDTSRKPLVRLSDNIELLHLYIQIENNRQGNRFDYTITTKGLEPTAIFIPGLILQPLAENAIVHGLNPKKNGQGKLQIEFSKSGSTLKIKVTDNGVGRQQDKDKRENHTSHAMNIIRETLSLMWQGREARDYFTVRDLRTNNISKGTEVTVLVPLSAS